MTLLTVERTNGERLTVPVDDGRSGVTLVSDSGFAEPIRLDGISGFELERGDRPSFVATYGSMMRLYPCWNEWTLTVGYEDSSVPMLQNNQRTALFTVAEIASVDVDPTRLTVPQPQEVN